ncbi:hypothetical protein [Peptacetobacter sp. AB845]|uniref:hypothetical protein n=1 Tax=Peptacetobacter sp. AB845 TaxID=3388429 RepID=UPI0039C95A8F
MTITKDLASATNDTDEELIDTLIAISVVAKKLAAKLRQTSENEREVQSNEQNVKSRSDS